MRVLIVSGSSGGHIFPALALIEALKDRDSRLNSLLVLPRSALKYNIAQTDAVKYISVCAFERCFAPGNFAALFEFLKGSLESLFLLLEFRPNVVVGFGGISSVPILLFAWLFRINTLIHEQNVIPGRANKLLAKFCDKIAISFSETKSYLTGLEKKIVFTGNPLRKSLKRVDKKESLSFFGLSQDKFTLLVMGGSQGSQRINACFLEALAIFPDHKRLQVIHITGDNDYAETEKFYQQLGVQAKVFAFLKQMQYAYSAAGLALCRAGATTISELAYFKLAAILIPYPFAQKHQLSNAKIMEKKECGVIIEEKALSAQVLKEKLEDFINHPGRLIAMRSGCGAPAEAPAVDLLAAQVVDF